MVRTAAERTMAHRVDLMAEDLKRTLALDVLDHNKREGTERAS